MSYLSGRRISTFGTLTELTVDDVVIDGKVVTMTGSSSDTAVFTAGTNGTLSIVTTDAAAAAANIQITADGTVDIDSAGVLTLDSGAAINIEPAAGSAILLDGTISIDAGVVTGATSITSTAFVGDITGDVAGNLSLSDASSVNISTPLLAGADHTYTGLSVQMLAGGAISAFDLVCIHTTTQEVVEADASAYSTARVIGIAPAAISDTATGTILIHGFIRDDTWAWTAGSTLYLSETAGAMTHTAPSTDGAFVQVVGTALSPDVVYINPSMDVIEHA